MRALWVGGAGFAGAVSRYWLSELVGKRVNGSFPWGTVVVNLSGCFLLGLLSVVLGERLGVDPAVRLAVTVGFLGAFTTYSTFAYETAVLGRDGAWLAAAANVVVSVSAGVGAAWLGIAAGRAL